MTEWNRSRPFLESAWHRRARWALGIVIVLVLAVGVAFVLPT